MKSPSPVLAVCATIVALAAIVAVTVLVAVDAEAESIGLLIGLITLLVTNVVTLTRGEQVKATVDDLSNGKMDAKIRAGLADILAPHLVDDDPTVQRQLEADRERRGGHPA